MLLAQAVHTTGVNWESVLAIATSISIIQVALFYLIARRDRQREAATVRRDKMRDEDNAELRKEIADSVKHLGDVLEARLETKEAVAKIGERVAVIEGTLRVAAARQIAGQ